LEKLDDPTGDAIYPMILFHQCRQQET